MEGGGHAVPKDRIRERYRRSLDQLPWFLDAADYALIYDNSGAEIRLIGKKQDEQIILDPEALPTIVKAVQTIRSE